MNLLPPLDESQVASYNIRELIIRELYKSKIESNETTLKMNKIKNI